MTEYRFLKEGEVIQKGDEWFDDTCGQWKPVSASIGDLFHTEEDEFDFRRVADPTDALTAARARIAELEAALANLRDTIVKLNPQIPSEIDGDPYCFFCGEWYGAHREDCLWRVTFNEAGKR